MFYDEGKKKKLFTSDITPRPMSSNMTTYNIGALVSVPIACRAVGEDVIWRTQLIVFDNCGIVIMHMQINVLESYL